jgi:endonuclease VIII
VPEGQISHRNARDFSAALVGKPLVRVWTGEPRLDGQRIPERLDGDSVTGAEAHGKHHVLRFASGRMLHSHLMMNGVWRLLRARRDPYPAGLYLALAVEGWTAALYRCPHVRLLEPHEPLPGPIRRLGPDLLGAGTAPADDTVAALARLDPSRQVGDAIMDQRVVAGIGNVYKSETLFLAGVDPWRPVGTLRPEEAARIGTIAADLLRKGVRERGRITTYDRPGAPPGRSVGGKWVYGRRNLPCRVCGTAIRSRGQGDDNRTTYWCPTCQS